MFIDICPFLMLVVVISKVPALYNRSVLSFLLKILALVLYESCPLGALLGLLPVPKPDIRGLRIGLLTPFRNEERCQQKLNRKNH